MKKKLHLGNKKPLVDQHIANKRRKHHLKRKKKKRRARSRLKEFPFKLLSKLNVKSEPEHTIENLMCFRKEVNKGQHIRLDIDDVVNIDAGAALMLTAEIDVWRRRSLRGRLKSHDKSWNPDIRKKLRDMGLFELLRIPPQSQMDDPNDNDVVFMKFRSGVRVDLEEYLTLRKEMEESIGRKIPHRTSLFAGVTEAVTNSFQHAYSKKKKETDRWWLSASYSRQTKELKVLCYDRGQTIPKTLPFSGIQERVMASLKNLGLSKIDADLIHAALVTKRTMTGELHRGKGIPELKSFIDKHGAGHLSIYSRNGIVHYEKRRNKLPEIRKKRIAKPILGTLIEWCIILD